MTKLAPEWVRTSDPVIRSPARYRWTTAPTTHFLGKLIIKPEAKLALCGPVDVPPEIEQAAHAGMHPQLWSPSHPTMEPVSTTKDVKTCA